MNVFDADRGIWVTESPGDIDCFEDYVSLYKWFSGKEGRKKAVKEVVESRGFSFSLGNSGKVFSAKFSIYNLLSNCIVFFSGESVILLLQFRSFCDGFIIPEFSAYVGRNQQPCIRRAEIVLGLYNSKYKFLGLNYFGGSSVNGWICSQPKPYHFFYDHAPYIQDYLGEAATEEKIITTEEGCFSDIKAFSKKHHIEIFKVIPKITPPGCFNVSIARDNFPERAYHKETLEIFDNYFRLFSQEKYGALCQWEGGEKSIKVWVFDAGSKRKWLNRGSFIDSLKSFFLTKFPSIKFLIINDGMTRPYFYHESSSLITCSSGSLGGIDTLCSVGLYYHFKYVLASGCDIFITDAATSSIIPARFLKRRVFCLVSDDSVSVHKGHSHYASNFVPAVRRTHENLSWVLDPFYVDFERLEPILEDEVNEVLQCK